MPTYEYECLVCGHKFEKFQAMSAKPIKKCPKCQGKVKRLFGTGGGIIFKGPGFYATDYRKDKPSTKSCCEKTEPGKTPPRSKNRESKKQQ